MIKFFDSAERRGKAGFTLIELLVVIGIIGVLASVVLASLNTARRKSRDARRVSDMKQVQLALELYFDSQNPTAYPAGDYAAATTALEGANCGGAACINTMPTDPTGTNPYQYVNIGTTSYFIGATLEDTDNAVLNNDIDGDFGATVGGCDDPVYCVRP